MSPLWDSRKHEGGKPKWLSSDPNAEKEIRKSRCDGSTAAETAADKAGHAGWTMPAGGNDNVNAQRECIACVGSMHSDFLESSSSSSTAAELTSSSSSSTGHSSSSSSSGGSSESSSSTLAGNTSSSSNSSSSSGESSSSSSSSSLG